MKLRDILSYMHENDYAYVSSQNMIGTGGIDRVSTWKEMNNSFFLDTPVISISSMGLTYFSPNGIIKIEIK